MKENYEKRTAEILANEDRVQAFIAATELAEFLRKTADQASILRGKIVYEMKNERKLTLAEVARILGVSKSRASQFVAMGKPDDENGPSSVS